MSGHVFLAVDLSDEERHRLSGALSAASPGSPVPGKRPPPANWHITLRFLGECSDTDADRIIHEVSEGLTVAPGKVFASGVGAFGRPSKATVLYVAIDDPEGLLTHVAGVCESAASDVAFDPGEHPFVPHLTLSRLRPRLDVRRLIESFGEFRVPIEVSTITLFRSVPSRSGITYDPLHTIDL